MRALGEVGNRIVDLGAQGVAIFFVISGYSVAASYATSEGYWDYLYKRLWRIAPLYYFWIGVAIIVGATATYWQRRFAVSVEAYNILMHLSFLSFLDYKIANTLLGVEWSIPIEVFWYLFIPLLMCWMISRKQLVIAIFLSLICYKLAVKYLTTLVAPIQDAALAIPWSPIPYALGFFLGIAAFRIRNYGDHFARWGNVMLIVVFGMISFLILKPTSSILMLDDYQFFSMATFLLILFGSSSSQLFRCIFTNKIVVYLGTISYGIYLCHLPLINILTRLNLIYPDSLGLAFLILLGCSILVSTVTYFIIERPGQHIGKLFYSRYKIRFHNAV